MTHTWNSLPWNKVQGPATSVAIHAGLFSILVIQFLVSPPQFGVARGAGAVEIDFIQSSSAGAVSPPAAKKLRTRAAADGIALHRATTETPNEEQHTVAASASAGSGATIQAEPNYLTNPAPRYPARAKTLRQEGVVLLAVDVDTRGAVKALSVSKSSGFSMLDEAALKAVKNWEFRPALSAGRPVEASVTIPVRFKIDSA